MNVCWEEAVKKTNSPNKKTYRNNSKISTVWMRLKVKRSLEKRVQHNPVCIYLLKESAIETEEKYVKSVSRLTIKSHIVAFDVALESLSLTLNIFLLIFLLFS